MYMPGYMAIDTIIMHRSWYIAFSNIFVVKQILKCPLGKMGISSYMNVEYYLQLLIKEYVFNISNDKA